MKDFRLKPLPEQEITVRNCWWRRSSEDSPPDRVLLDIGQIRGGSMEWNSSVITPRRARAIAAALVKAAAEAES